MPTLTPKLGIKKPLGNETVTRQGFNDNWDIIDLEAARAPFRLKSAIYDGTGNQIVCTIGPGQAAFLGTVVSQAGDAIYNIPAPAISTDYYLYLKSDGTYTHNTTGASITGAVKLWRVTTGDPVSTITTTDLRGELPGADAQVVKDQLDSHKNATTLDHPALQILNMFNAGAIRGRQRVEQQADTTVDIIWEAATGAAGSEAYTEIMRWDASVPEFVVSVAWKYLQNVNFTQGIIMVDNLSQKWHFGIENGRMYYEEVL